VTGRGHRSAQTALDAAGVQLALGLHEEELGESVELADIDPAKADAAMERLWAAVMAATTRPKPCSCIPAPLVLDEDGTCSKCGRTP
jgi:hypothetical protein